MVCFRYIIVNSLYNSDNKDNKIMMILIIIIIKNRRRKASKNGFYWEISKHEITIQ